MTIKISYLNHHDLTQPTLQVVKVSIFPIGNWRRRYNSAACEK